MGLKLYRVTLRQCPVFLSRFSVGYVVAEDPTSAYILMCQSLNSTTAMKGESLELDRVELVAENTLDPLCRSRLYLPPEDPA